MPGHKATLEKFDQVHQQTVELLKLHPVQDTGKSNQILSLINELRIYQDELEQQNEELKQVTRELSRIHREFSNLYEFAPCGYVTLNTDGLITSTNQLAVRLLGKKHLLLGQSSFTNYIDRDHKQSFENTKQKAGETGTRQSVELPLISHKDKTLWIRLEIDAERNKKGVVTQWRMILLDTSEQRKTETELRFQNKALNEILDKAADGICVFYNPNESPHFKFTHWNPRMTEIVGYSMDEINQLGWFQSLYPDSKIQKKAIERMEVMRPGKNILGDDWPITTKSGKEKEISISASIIRTDQDRSYRLAIVREVTGRRVQEKSSHQIKKAESLSRMAGAVAHHFKNTLQGTIGNIQLAREYLTEGRNISTNLDRAEQSAQKAADLTGHLLTYLGQDRTRSEPLNLAAICRAQLNLFAASIPDSIRLDTYCIASEPVIEGNGSKLEQALQALLTNACEAVLDNPRGCISVTVGTAHAPDINGAHCFPLNWTAAVEDYATLTITDTGCGMQAQTMDRIFDPFFTDKSTGRGLGLAVVLGIVKAHHGCITVESRLGVGSTFKMFFPLKNVTADLPVEFTGVPEHTVEFAGTVLLVDDNDMVRTASQDMLEHLGFEVLIAHDGAEAVAVYRDNHARIRLVLSDLSMPRMNGWETLAAIRSIKPDIPFILTSGYDEARAMGGEHKQQPQVFLPKPATLRSLQEAVLKALL